MRGSDETNGSLFGYVDLEDRIPSGHPLRKIRLVVNDALASLRASLIQLLFSVSSERQLMGQMQYSLLFRWVVGFGIDDPVWVPTVFTKNCDRLLEHVCFTLKHIRHGKGSSGIRRD